ncbi:MULTISPECIES: hypothetical protein [unclassified Bradyrhizobium]|uniref:hypothetical protein n=1 Tax=unclassified Bradyrhizobium TaxID=2631580 RepID=UPI00339432E8
MGKPVIHLTPEQRAAAAQQQRRLKSPRMQAEAESLQRIGQKLGFNQMAETLRNAGLPEPAPPTEPQLKGARPGRKRSISREQIDKGVRILLDKPKMSVKAARIALRVGGIKGEDGPLYRLIIKPTYARMSK